MTEDPDQIRQEIEATRRAAEVTLEEIEDRVTPSRVVERTKDQARAKLSDAKASVMGKVEDAKASVMGTVEDAKGSVVGTVGDAKGGVRGTVEDARVTVSELKGTVDQAAGRSGQAARQQFRGNPLAAGLIAFGLGAVAGSLMPPTRAEERAARRLDELLAPAKNELVSSGAELAQDLKEEAQEALQEVKGQAQEAVQEVKDDARDAAREVKGEARDAAQEVKGEAQDAAHGAGAPPVPAAAGEAYEQRSLRELRELAVARGIVGRSTMTKAQLVAALRASEPVSPTPASAPRSSRKAGTGDGGRVRAAGRGRARYEERSLRELRELAAGRGIVGRSAMTKEELIAALRR
ncbi:MAG TPA: DUF3618 domain-containing protein [Egibacteraceae bacterium]|nr:DUF3618 domain-containing protein [Egibacteraceae bacterium]